MLALLAERRHQSVDHRLRRRNQRRHRPELLLLPHSHRFLLEAPVSELVASAAWLAVACQSIRLAVVLLRSILLAVVLLAECLNFLQTRPEMLES